MAFRRVCTSHEGFIIFTFAKVRSNYTLYERSMYINLIYSKPLITLKKIAISLGVALTSLLPLVALGADDFTSPSDATSVISTFTSDFGTILHAALPTILVIVASLIGISVLIRWVRRHAK